jgi:hypothetical protein
MLKNLKHSETTKKKISEAMQGDKNHNWNGGRTKDDDGYIRLYSPTHPFANGRGYIPEHRLIMEQYLNRFLSDGEVVYHVDGNK